jgi:uncharacterized protein YcfL
MKKVTLILASLAILATASCKDKEEATVVEKETVVIEKEADTPTAEEETDGTSISVNKDGVEISSKDGDKKTEVEVKDGEGTVKVEK